MKNNLAIAFCGITAMFVTIIPPVYDFLTTWIGWGYAILMGALWLATWRAGWRWLEEKGFGDDEGPDGGPGMESVSPAVPPPTSSSTPRMSGLLFYIDNLLLCVLQT